MAESTLALTRTNILNRMCRKLGYGTAYASASAAEQAEIDELEQSGLRQFYFPPSLNGETPHQWSFLNIGSTLTLVADAYQTALPDSFGSLDGEFSYASDSGQGGPVKTVTEQYIRKLREGNASTGAPRYCAIQAIAGTVLAEGQRYQAVWWPTPNSAYVMQYSYSTLPDDLTALLPYPLGGLVHAETILASCLAIIEIETFGEEGVAWNRFMRQMTASIRQDLSLGPQFLGRMLDKSADSHDVEYRTATVNGVTPL